MKVTLDWKKNEATIVVPITATPALSATGNTESLASIRNQDVLNEKLPSDGRQIKCTLQLYVKPKKA